MSASDVVYVDYLPEDFSLVSRYMTALTVRGYRLKEANGYADADPGAHYAVVYFVSAPRFGPYTSTEPPYAYVEVRIHDHAPKQQWMEDHAFVDAVSIGFDAAIDELVKLLGTPRRRTDHVFISYARKDSSLVDQIVHELRNKGIAGWIDYEGLQLGTTDWEREIRQNIVASDGVIYVATEDAASSQYVRDELAIARDNHIPVYPIWVRGTVWSSCIPLGWGQTQYVDGRADKFDSAVQSLIATLKMANGDS